MAKMDFNGYYFDPEDAVEKTVKWIREWFEENGPGCNAIIGVSGGKDSSIVAALMVEALGAERVIGVVMPNGAYKDMDMAMLLINHLGIRHHVIDIKGAYDSIMAELERDGVDIKEDTKINLPPRLRMSTLYAVGQSNNGRVVNTCNLSEDWVGYSTRYGDSVGDFSPTSCFTVAEIKAMGRSIGIPNVLIDKVPDDGLSGMTDEDKLGFTYKVLDHYIRTGEIEDAATKERIDTLHRRNLFKLRFMDCYKYENQLPTKADA